MFGQATTSEYCLENPLFDLFHVEPDVIFDHK